MQGERPLLQEVPKKGEVKKKQMRKKCGCSCQGEAPKVKGKVITKLNSISRFTSSMHRQNSYVHLSIHNFSFKYHDRFRVNMYDNFRK